MARGSSGRDVEENKDKSGAFFMATLIMWGVSILYELMFNNRNELFTILLSFVFFQLVNWIIYVCLARGPLFSNTCVSLLHSFITAASGAYAAICFSLGYFAYDQLDMLLNRLYTDLIPSSLVHHLRLLVCFTLSLYRNITINYLIHTLICELHSTCLHLRKARRMAGIRDTRIVLVKIEWVFNFVTFITARLIPHVLITVKLLMDAPKFEKGVELPLVLFGMAGMNIFDVFLWIYLIKACRKEFASSRNK